MEPCVYSPAPTSLSPWQRTQVPIRDELSCLGPTPKSGKVGTGAQRAGRTGSPCGHCGWESNEEGQGLILEVGEARDARTLGGWFSFPNFGHGLSIGWGRWWGRGEGGDGLLSRETGKLPTAQDVGRQASWAAPTLPPFLSLPPAFLSPERQSGPWQAPWPGRPSVRRLAFGHGQPTGCCVT